MWFKEQGYLPEAVRNFLQLLGYAGDDESDVKSFEDFVREFSWSKVHTVGPIFDLKKLDWLNGHYIRSLSVDELTQRIVAWAKEYDQWAEHMSIDVLRQAVPIIQERLVTLSGALPQLDYLFTNDIQIADDARATLKENAAEVLDETLAVMESVPMEAAAIQAALRERLCDGLGIKPRFAFGPLRVAIAGKKVSPPLFESMEILGRDESVRRLRALRAEL